jgi:hypothetical protein
MQWFHCDECGWSTTNPREFDAHVQQRHEGKPVPWVVDSGLAREGFSWRVYLVRLSLFVAVVVILIMIARAR